ncbi:ATP phosphoribosyltransferase regulatory subunit [Sutcliffiella cohnii]|nr:ATP phosphoribosyltransferase regulatory subunit [Sutcliffiella cohnii]
MMSKLFTFEKPLGMRDTLPALYEAKQTIKKLLASEINSWGYQFMDTPTLEYYDTVGSASAILDHQLFKLLDQQGKTLVLRPDMTAPIARVAASQMEDTAQQPLRLAYSGNVFRAQQNEAGKPAEFEQVGVECIGDGTISADAEMIALLVSLLKKVNIQPFTIAVGHIGFVQQLFLEVVKTEENAEKLGRFLYEKNYVGYREYVKSLQLDSKEEQRLLTLLQVRGDYSKIELAQTLVESEEGVQAIEELQQLWTMLEAYGVTEFVKLDLNIVSHMSYYTGILFEVYAGNVGAPIGNGGRYNQLFEKFNKQKPATGFGLYLDRLLDAKGYKGEIAPRSLVLFSKDRKLEAIQYAQMKRNDGERVVVQDIDGLQHIEACIQQYETVYYFIDREV